MRKLSSHKTSAEQFRVVDGNGDGDSAIVVVVVEMVVDVAMVQGMAMAGMETKWVSRDMAESHSGQ